MYNIDITSDIHTSFISSKYKDLFGNNGVLKQSQNAKYLIIAGDINEDIHEIEKILNNTIDNTSYQKIIITFGNHDIWYRPNINRNDNILDYNNSIEKYNFLIDYFHEYKNKIHVIDKDDFIIKDSNIILTGNMGWYNYTINQTDKQYLENDVKVNFDKMSYGTFNSADRIGIKFSNDIKSNIQLASLLENRLIDRIKTIKKNTDLNNYQIIAISHVKPSYKLEINSPYFLELDKDQWNNIIKDGINKNQLPIQTIYSNAFYLNNNLSEIYKDNNIKLGIYGHTHWQYKKSIDGVKYITNSFGYYLNENNNGIITI